MMNKTIRHLEHHFHVNGRLFVVYVFNKNQPSSKLFREILKQETKIDVSVYSYQPADVKNVAPDDLRAMSSLIVENIKSCLPSSVPPAQWIQFENAVSHWICNHRRLPLRVLHEGWMKRLARRIGLVSPKTT
jgi:hypothetical protein